MGKIMNAGTEYGGGGGTGASSMTQLTDVDLTDLSDGDILRYDSEEGKWISVEEDYLHPIIYSLNERVVGVWTDGKPLYQKTYAGAEQTTTNPTTIDSDVKTTSGIYQVRSIKGVWAIGSFTYSTTTLQELDTEGTFSGGSTKAYCRVTPSGLQLIRSNNSFGVQYLITIQYTKSTDTPGSGSWTPSGVPAIHYSASEQVIGTWFGKPLYQKSYSLGKAPGENNKTGTLTACQDTMSGGIISRTCYYKNYSLNMTFADIEPIHLEVFARTSSGSFRIVQHGTRIVQSDYDIAFDYREVNNQSTIMVWNKEDRSSAWDVYATIQYTKVAD